MISGSTLLIPLLIARDITSFGFVWATKYPLQCLHLINWCKLISVRDSHLAQASAACPPAAPLSASPGMARGATQATRTWGTSCFPSEHRPAMPPRTTGGRSPWPLVMTSGVPFCHGVPPIIRCHGPWLCSETHRFGVPSLKIENHFRSRWSWLRLIYIYI